MTTIDNDILLLEQFIKEEEQRLNEGIITDVATMISAITSIPLVLDLIRLALQKFNYFQFKFYLPELDVDDPSLASILKPRSAESTVGDEDIKHSPERVQNIIKFINKYGMKAAEGLNRYNNKDDKLEFEKSSPIVGHQEIKIAKLRGQDPIYQISLMIMSIRQNLQLIFDETFETIAAGIIEIIDKHPGISVEATNRDFYETVVAKLAKLIVFIIVGISIFQSATGAAAQSVGQKGVSLIKKGIKFKKFFEFIRDLEIFLLEIAALFGNSEAVIQLAIVNEATTTIDIISRIKAKISDITSGDFLENFKKIRAKHDKARSEETSKRYRGVTQAQDKLAARQDHQDYYGSPVDYSLVDNFLRQYIRMLLS